ncbi:hypothetical protein [Nitrospirillum iridis]|uniref:HAMP domain-containing protein n=1 Tax=Nitrospirillum iridis TaxID=765888 RepID=A0A7X0EE67_9PROT|nr:hypothetical protein [Nitrospirillum iridis]MBB6252735.1 hypothetical protein [Nitrospirillum iridis]
MRLKVQLLLPVICVAALGGVLVAAGQTGQDQAARVAQSLDQARLLLVQATDVRALSRSLQRDAMNTLLEPAADRAAFAARAAARLDEMRALVATVRDRAPDAAFLAPQAQAVTEMAAVVAAARAGDDSGALLRLRTEVGPQDAQAAGLAQTFIDARNQDMDTLSAEAGRLRSETGRLAAWTGVLGMAGAMMALATLALLLARRPLARLLGAGSDDLRAVMDAAARGDELGDWARALMALRTQAQERNRRATARMAAPQKDRAALAA